MSSASGDLVLPHFFELSSEILWKEQLTLSSRVLSVLVSVQTVDTYPHRLFILFKSLQHQPPGAPGLLGQTQRGSVTALLIKVAKHVTQARHPCTAAL